MSRLPTGGRGQGPGLKNPGPTDSQHRGTSEMVAEPFVRICLPGPPRGKGRPRTRVIGKFATIYTDSATRAFESRLKSAGIEAMRGKEPLCEALSVRVMAYMPIPASWPAKRQKEAVDGLIFPTSGIDLDIIVKMFDGVNYRPPRFKGDRERSPIIWQNDSQIINLHAMKVYSDQPRLEIEVFRW